MSKPSTGEFDLDAFSLGLNAETDRACGVLGAALLDARLEAVFRRRLRCFQDELLGRMSPLGSFSARIRAARALGWISDDANVDLDTIRGVRNNFAHSADPSLSFTDQSIADRCLNLRSANAYVNGFDVAATAPGRALSSHAIEAMRSAFISPRQRYQLAVEFLAQYLDALPPNLSDYAGPDLLVELQALSANVKITVAAQASVTPAPSGDANAK
jgi:hypothetical protein